MPSQGLPVFILSNAIRLAPRAALEHFLDLFTLRMEKLHPRLFRDLARMNKALIYFEPLDSPRRFSLTTGVPYPEFRVVEGESEGVPDAVISAPLADLLDMLEGRSDGDTLFFSRGMTVTGDTSAVVELRNILDRAEIDLLDDMASFLGPFAGYAARALPAARDIARRARELFGSR